MDPYRLFFPLGACSALLGTLPWLLFVAGLSKNHPVLLHADWMVGGFLFAFAAGFLMTAVPRFTGSMKSSAAENGIGVFIFTSMMLLGFLAQRAWFHGISLISLVFLVTFAARRVVRRTVDPPPFFVFVGLGLLFGTIGALLLFLSDISVLQDARWILLGRLIYTQGMILALVLGVGTRLLPAIWGWAELPVHQTVQLHRIQPISSFRKQLRPVFALAFILLLSFAVEILLDASLGRFIRALLVTVIAVRWWKIYKKPLAQGSMAFWLWISAWFLLLGLWAAALFPTYWVHALHLAFIGGFGLMTLMIASRVILAHGGHGRDIEQTSKIFSVLGFLILSAAILRATSLWLSPAYYLHWIACVAVLWGIALILWLAFFIKKMVYIRS